MEHTLTLPIIFLPTILFYWDGIVLVYLSIVVDPTEDSIYIANCRQRCWRDGIVVDLGVQVPKEVTGGGGGGGAGGGGKVVQSRKINQFKIRETHERAKLKREGGAEIEKPMHLFFIKQNK